MLKFTKTTVLGGVVFLFPVVVLIAIIGKALSVIHTLATPLLVHVEVETIAGIAVIHILSVTILILVCFLAGLWAKTPGAAALVQSLEDNLLQNFPPYALLKAKTGSALNPQVTDKLTPVLVQFDDSWQVAYEVEAIAQGKNLVFLPGAPDPWSGYICAVDSKRITPLDTSVKSVGALMKRLGKGSSEIFNIREGDDKNP